MNKSGARISLEFYIRNGLADRAHMTGITAGEKAEVVVEDVISNLLDPSALRTLVGYAVEQGIEMPLPPLRLWIDLAVEGHILQGNFDITNEEDIIGKIDETLLLIYNTHNPDGSEWEDTKASK